MISTKFPTNFKKFPKISNFIRTLFKAYTTFCEISNAEMWSAFPEEEPIEEIPNNTEEDSRNIDAVFLDCTKCGTR